MNRFKKVLTFLLAGIIAFSGALFTNNSAFAAKYTRYYNRGSSYYYSQAGWWNLGGNRRSGYNGCGITSFAIAYSVLKGRRVTPLAVAKLAYRKGYWNLSGNTPTNLTKKLASSTGLSYREISKNPITMVKALLSGYVLIIRAHGSLPFTSGGHYIVVVGASSNGYFKVVDPGHRDYRPKAMHYRQFLASMKSSYSIFAVK